VRLEYKSFVELKSDSVARLVKSIMGMTRSNRRDIILNKIQDRKDLTVVVFNGMLLVSKQIKSISYTK